MTRTYKNKAELQNHIIDILTLNNIKEDNTIYQQLVALTANKKKQDIRDTKINILDTNNNIVALYDDKFNAYFTVESFKETQRNKSNYEHMTIKATKLHLMYKNDIDNLKITKQDLTSDFMQDKMTAKDFKQQLQDIDTQIESITATQKADYTIEQYNELADSDTNAVITKQDELTQQYKTDIYA